MNALEYAPKVTWARRRYRVLLLVVPALVVSYVLAVPRVRAFREREARRAAVRQTVAAQVQVARSMLAAGRVGDAADALIQAEFPRRVEGDLFGRGELETIDRQIAGLREAVCVADLQNWWEGNERRKAELAERMRAEAEQSSRYMVSHPAGGEYEIVRRNVHRWTRRRTVEALADRAGEQLKAGRMTQALAICRQIAVMEPSYGFGEALWANVTPKP
jgi:hypothetical protein